MSRSRLTRRRTLLRFGAAAAVTAMALGAVGAMGTSATATQGQAILAGQYNDEGHSTDLVNTGGAGANGNGLVVSASTDAKGYGVLSTGFGLGNAGVKGIGGAKAYGVYGESLSTFGVGVHGEGEDTGVEGHGGFYGIHGTGPFGVTGESTASGPGVSGAGSPGVEGLGTGSGSIGLYGHGEAFGVKGDTSPVGVYGGGTSEGLHGFSDSGIGVYAVTNGGIALHVEGPLQLSRSGRATIAGSSSDPRISVKVSNVALSPDSSVLATLQKHAAGVYIEAAVPNPSKGTIVIYLNKSVTSSFPVVWMVIET